MGAQGATRCYPLAGGTRDGAAKEGRVRLAVARHGGPGDADVFGGGHQLSAVRAPPMHLSRQAAPLHCPGAPCSPPASPPCPPSRPPPPPTSLTSRAGCWNDTDASLNVPTYYRTLSVPGRMTLEGCAAAAVAANYTVWALRLGSLCVVPTSAPDLMLRFCRAPVQCNDPCRGNLSQVGGGAAPEGGGGVGWGQGDSCRPGLAWPCGGVMAPGLRAPEFSWAGVGVGAQGHCALGAVTAPRREGCGASCRAVARRTIRRPGT